MLVKERLPLSIDHKFILYVSFAIAILLNPLSIKGQPSLEDDQIKAIARTLIEAKSKEEQEEILNKHKQVAIKLLEELGKRASRLNKDKKYDLAITVCDLSIMLAKQVGDEVEKGKAISLKGLIKFNENKYDEALKYYRESLEVGESIGDKNLIGKTFQGIGTVYFRMGNYPLALENFFKNLKLSEEINHKERINTALLKIGVTYRQQGDYLQALDYLLRSLEVAEARNDGQSVARAYLHIGIVYRNLGDYPQAMDSYLKSLKGFKEMPSEHGVARVLHNIGVLHRNQGNYAQALNHHLKSLEISKTIDDKEGFIKSLLHITNLYMEQGNYSEAVDYYLKCMKIVEELEDKSGDISLSNDQTLYDEQSKYPPTLDYYLKSLKIEEAIGNKPIIARILNTIGALYNTQGNYALALENLNKSLTIRKEIGDKQGLISSLNSIGIVHNSQGSYSQALDYHLECLRISKEIGDKNGIAESLNNIGNTYKNQGNYAEALGYYIKSLKIKEEIGDKIGIATTHTAIGYFHKQQRNFKEAVEYYQKSLEILEASNSQATRAITLIGLGLTYIDQIYHQSSQTIDPSLIHKSKSYLLEGLNTCRILGLSPHEAEALRGLALFESRQGNWTESTRYIEDAIKIIESIRMNVADDKRIFYFSSVQDYYDLYIKALMQLDKLHPNKGYLQLAFQAADRSRARVLVEFLMQPEMNIDQNVSPELNEQKRKIQEEIDLKSEEHLNLLGSKRTKEQMQVTEKHLEKLIKEYEEIQAKIRQSNPRYTQLMQPQAIKVENIQQLILDKESLLLQYHLGDDKSYLWAITTESISGYELPKRSEIENMARDFYDTLTARSKPDFAKQNNEAILKRDKEVALRLSKTLLGPISGVLGKKRLLIVADGALNFIPFAALPITRNKDTNSTYPLITNHEIVNLPSASTLLALNQETRAIDNKLIPASFRQPNEIKQNRITIFADPVFDKRDLRVTTNASNHKNSNKHLKNKARGSLFTSKNRLAQREIQSNKRENPDEIIFPRLEYTRHLAQQISTITPMEEVEAILDFDASKERVLSEKLSESQIIIFATHGLVNNKYPELSGMMMSRVDRKGKSQNGFLQLRDVYKMRLNAKLVILGACETAIGEEIKGEGIIGLTRGFMYAGAKGVIASLWKVDEIATVELIKRMYENIRRKGLNPSEALRTAQESMRREKKWEDPYYWSGFVLIGDWRQKIEKM